MLTKSCHPFTKIIFHVSPTLILQASLRRQWRIRIMADVPDLLIISKYLNSCC